MWGYTPVLSGRGHVAGACEGSNESSFSKKVWVNSNVPEDLLPSRKESAAWS